MFTLATSLGTSLFTEGGNQKLKSLRTELKNIQKGDLYKTSVARDRSKQIVDASYKLLDGLLSCWTGVTQALHLQKETAAFSALIDSMGAGQGYIFSANDALSFKTAEVFSNVIKHTDLEDFLKKEAIDELKKINPNLKYIFENFKREFAWRLTCFKSYLTKDTDFDRFLKIKGEIRASLFVEDWPNFVKAQLKKITSLPLLRCGESSHIQPSGKIEAFYFSTYQKTLIADLLGIERLRNNNEQDCLNAVKTLVSPPKAEEFNQKCEGFFVSFSAGIKSLVAQFEVDEGSAEVRKILENLQNNRVLKKDEGDTNPDYFNKVLDFIFVFETAINTYGQYCRQQGQDPGLIGHLFNKAQEELGKLFNEYGLANNQYLLQAIQPEPVKSTPEPAVAVAFQLVDQLTPAGASLDQSGP